MPAPPPEENDAKALMLVAGLIAGLLVLPVVACAAAAWYPARRWLGRELGWVLVVVGIVGFALDARRNAVDYFSWWPGMWFGQGAWPVPVIPIALGAAVVCGAALMLSGTAIAARLPNPFRRKTNPLETESILPTDGQRERAQVAVPVGGLTADINDHSFVSSTAGARQFPIGIGTEGQTIHMSEDELKAHMAIFGSTGSGKSEALKAIVGCLLDLGWSGMVLDLKEDTKPGGLRDFCFDYAQHHTLPYQELRLSDPESMCWLNTFRGMSADEARDTILTLAPGDDFYYSALTSKTIGQCLTLLYDAHRVDPATYPYPTPFDLGVLMSKGAAMGTATRDMRAAALMALGDQRNKEDYRSVSDPSADEAKNAVGASAKILTIYQGDSGRTVLRARENARELDVTAAGVTYVGLDTLGKPALTQMVSASVLQRMSVMAAQRTTGRDTTAAKQRFIVIDEANRVNREILNNILSRARSAGVTMILATQAPLDWEVQQSAGHGQGAAGFAALAGNINAVLVMRQAEPANAEICAELLGKRRVYQTSARVLDGAMLDAGTARETEDYWVKPYELIELRTGEGVLRVGSPSPRITHLRVAMRDPRLSPRR